MTPLPHRYEVHLAGGPSGYAELSTPGVPTLRVAAPADYDGPGDAWSPEHMLVGAIESCFLLTFRTIARVSKLDFLSLTLEATGTIDRQEGVTRFTEIVVSATITVRPGIDHERVLRLLEKSEKNCLVAASLSTPVRLAAVVREQ